MRESDSGQFLFNAYFFKLFILIISMFRIIKISSSLGSPERGEEVGPEKIVSVLSEQFPELTKTCVNIPIPEHNPEHEVGDYGKVKNLPEVKQICLQVRDTVADVLLNRDTPLVFHGDDSYVLGVAFGVSSILREPFGIIYFDAHGDLNTPETSPSGNLFGMGLAHILGRGHPELLALNNNKPAVNEKNIVLIGQRNLDEGEKDFIKNKQISMYDPQKIHNNLEEILVEIRNKFEQNGIKKIYLHFDQDAVDPKESGATLCPEPNGLHTEEVYKIIEFLNKEFEIITISIGNYYATKDTENKTLKVIMTLLQKLNVI